jgi:rubrerythrin
MGWDIGNYTPAPSGTPFDFALLREGFARLQAAAAENKDWKCEKCGTTGKTPNPPMFCPVCGAEIS